VQLTVDRQRLTVVRNFLVAAQGAHGHVGAELVREAGRRSRGSLTTRLWGAPA
jgi:hypothetical protein